MNKDKIVSIIASHNSRIQCFLDKLNPNTNKTRFQNCAIIRLSLTSEKVDLELVYSGELNEKEIVKLSNSKPYYTTPNKLGPTGLIKYENWTRSTQYVIDMLNLTPDELIGKNYIFYIVRHGQGQHNKQINLKVAKVSSTLGLVKDTRVTNVGESQAYKSGLALKDILNIKDEKINYWFVSDLVRTRQTIVEIIRGLNIPKPKELVVLPCSSEINTSGSGKGDCDLVASSSINLSKLARENYPKCKINDIENKNDLNGCNNIEGIPINWNFYLTFYAGQMRSQNDTAWNYISGNKNVFKQKCRNTNMVAMAIFFINSGNYFNEIQGHRFNFYKKNLSDFINKRKQMGGKLTKKNKRKYMSKFNKSNKKKVIK